jgi:hypothetical protein
LWHWNEATVDGTNDAVTHGTMDYTVTKHTTEWGMFHVGADDSETNGDVNHLHHTNKYKTSARAVHNLVEVGTNHFDKYQWGKIARHWVHPNDCKAHMEIQVASYSIGHRCSQAVGVVRQSQNCQKTEHCYRTIDTSVAT